MEYSDKTLVNLIEENKCLPGGDITPRANYKIRSETESLLALNADKDFEGKQKYVEFYRDQEPEYYDKGIVLINKVIKTFLGENVSDELRSYLIVDMIYSLHRFGCPFDEYFLFDFVNKNFVGRNQYATDKVRPLILNRLNLQVNHEIFSNKFKAYELFKEYYGRTVIEVRSKDDYVKFKKLMDANDAVIVKPAIDGGFGSNTHVFKKSDFNDIEGMFEAVRNVKDVVVVEQLIKQTKAMSIFHPESVNTIRITAIKEKRGNDVAIFYPFVRFGRGEMIVDNGGAGGILAGVDANTGIIYTSGVDEAGHQYLTHPDTGIQIVGSVIPRWGEAVELVKVAMKKTSNRYIGWDLALTDNGWVVVEANSDGQFICQQMVQGRGLLKELLELI